jgi:outer membrane murein-binding lipoprotein Lpp
MIGQKLSALAMASCVFLFVVSGCVSQQKYDALQGRYDQLNQTMSAEINSKQMHIANAYRETSECDQGDGQRSASLSFW